MQVKKQLKAVQPTEQQKIAGGAHGDFWNEMGNGQPVWTGGTCDNPQLP